jgi:hypothetical protein
VVIGLVEKQFDINRPIDTAAELTITAPFKFNLSSGICPRAYAQGFFLPDKLGANYEYGCHVVAFNIIIQPGIFGCFLLEFFGWANGWFSARSRRHRVGMRQSKFR